MQQQDGIDGPARGALSLSGPAGWDPWWYRHLLRKACSVTEMRGDGSLICWSGRLELAPCHPSGCDDSSPNEQGDRQQRLNGAKIQGVARDEQRRNRSGDNQDQTNEPSHFGSFHIDRYDIPRHGASPLATLMININKSCTQ